LAITGRIFYLFRKLVNKSRNPVCFSEVEISSIITYSNSIFQFLYRPRILSINNNKVCVNTCLIYIFVDFYIRSEECDTIKKEIRISVFPRVKSVNKIAFFATIITRPENKFQFLIIFISRLLYCRCF
jgi:hypothetical protein